MVRKAKVEFDERPPDDFDPKNPYGDPVAMLEYREHLVREKWIQIETAKIIRERLRWCYRIEGINHHQKCRHLVDQYLEATRGVGWGKDARPPEFHAQEGGRGGGVAAALLLGLPFLDWGGELPVELEGVPWNLCSSSFTSEVVD
ncbi:hypothetical protein ACP4OV_002991 [Aristida adscensionis]